MPSLLRVEQLTTVSTCGEVDCLLGIDGTISWRLAICRANLCVLAFACRWEDICTRTPALSSWLNLHNDICCQFVITHCQTGHCQLQQTFQTRHRHSHYTLLHCSCAKQLLVTYDSFCICLFNKYNTIQTSSSSLQCNATVNVPVPPQLWPVWSSSNFNVGHNTM